MRVFDEAKTKELKDYSLEKGWLKEDKLFVKHHERVSAQTLSIYEQEAEIIRSGGKTERINGNVYQIVKEYANGGKEVRQIAEEVLAEGKEAYDEYEDIYVFVPFTEKQLEKRYEEEVERLIREKYSVSNELAIMRQRYTKEAEFYEYDTYAENCKREAWQKIYGA